MSRIAVLMSTYNGEKYLRQQIDTILGQKGNFQLQLIVRDDGSKDGTIAILEEYASDNRIMWYQGTNCGPAKSFMDLLKRIDGYDYYAFADQDDYWMDNKLAVGLNVLSDNKPELYCANGMVVNEKLEYLGNNVYRKKPSTDFNTMLIAGGLLGCTMIFNEKLANIIRSKDVPEAMVMHDFYLALICAGIGGNIIYDDKALIKYRQHGGNVVGVSNGILDKIKDRVSSIRHKSSVSIADQGKDVLDRYADVILEDNKKFLKKVANYNKSIWSRISLSFSLKTRYVNFNKCITLRLAILLGNR